MGQKLRGKLHLAEFLLNLHVFRSSVSFLSSWDETYAEFCHMRLTPLLVNSNVQYLSEIKLCRSWHIGLQTKSDRQGLWLSYKLNNQILTVSIIKGQSYLFLQVDNSCQFSLTSVPTQSSDFANLKNCQITSCHKKGYESDLMNVHKQFYWEVGCKD